MTQMAGAEDVITKDTVLYPLMLEDTSTDGMPTNNYVAALDVTDLNYAVTVKVPSLQAVKDGLIWLEISNGGIPMDFTVTDNGDGTYTIRTVEPLKAGKTYQLRVQDREKMPATGVLVNALDSYIRFYHNGELQSIDVEYYNIFTVAQEVNNLKLSNGLVLIPISQVTGIDLEEAVSLISLAPDENGEMGLSENAQTGTFQYTGDKVLQPSDVVFIFEGDPTAVEEEYASSGTVSAATIDDIQTSIDSHVRVPVNAKLTEQEQVLLENKVIQQALDSGFAEKAAALAVQEKLGLEEDVVWDQQYTMTRRMAQTFAAEFGPEVDIEDFEIDAGIFLIQLQMDPPDVNANITSNLQRITTINGGEGTRVASVCISP